MASKKQILIEREGLLALKELVEVYQETAATRMQRVRGAVLQSRQFMAGLVEVFRRVRVAYERLPLRQRSRYKRNGRTVVCFVSANAGLYGDIVERTFTQFANFVKKEKGDVVVLGKLGTKMMAEQLPELLYNYFDVSDEGVEEESFDVIMRYLIQFERIVVFHGQFKTILVQDPRMTEVSATAAWAGKEEAGGGTDYLFEPSVGEIAHIFEGEILASVFEQSLHESLLSKYASRLMALDKSIENIGRRQEVVRRLEVKVTHKIKNRKQLNTMSGVALWQ